MTTTTDPTREMLQAAVDATWNAHDPAALAAACAEDATLRVVATGEVAHGQEALQQLAESRLTAFPDWHIDVRRAFTAGDLICAEFVLTGTQRGEFLGHAPTNSAIRVELCSVLRLTADGRVAEETVYFDLATILGQLGVKE